MIGEEINTYKRSAILEKGGIILYRLRYLSQRYFALFKWL